MRFQHLTASLVRPGQATQYTAGDIIANSQTGSAVVPITFTVPDGANRRTGRLTGARAVVTPASGNLVITACDFDLLLFRPGTDLPFAAGSFPADNAAMAISAAAYRELVGVFRFINTAWRNTLGALTADVTGHQNAACVTRPSYPFSLNGLSSNALIGVVQAIGVWNPGNVAQTFNFTLDLEQE